MNIKGVLFTAILAGATMPVLADNHGSDGAMAQPASPNNDIEATEKYPGFYYYGISYMQLKGNATAGPEYSPNGVTLRLGRNFGDRTAIEFQYSGSEDVKDTDGNTFQVETMNTLLYRAGMPYEAMEVYALLGVARTNVTVGTFHDTSDGAAWGVGAQLSPRKNFDVTIEWMHYASRAEYEVESVNLGIIKRFE